MAEVTDPALLEQLNSPTEVTDPKLLAALNGETPHPSQQQPEAFTLNMLPLRFDPANDAGFVAAARNAAILGPTPAALVSFLRGRGLGLAVPKMIIDVLQANDRGIAGAYAEGEEGQRQRTQDGLAVAGSMIGMPPGVGAAAKAIPAAAGAMSDAAPAAVGVGSREAALQAAERIGVDVPRAAAGGYVERATGAALRDLPVVGDPLVKASEKALGQLEGAANKVADDLGGSSALSAGYAAKDSIVDWVTNVSKAEADEIYRPARELIGDTTAPLTNTQQAVDQLTRQAAEIGQQPPTVVNYLNPAIARGPLTFEQMQTLRTQIGDRISGSIVPEPGTNKTALKVAYKALTDDIDALAAQSGDKAKLAWQQANDTFRTQIAAKRDRLTKIVGLEGEANPELVAQRLTEMAGAKRGADIERLRAARETMSNEAWGELGSSVVANLGRSKDGFSLGRFRTDYAKLSDDGKALLFGPEHRQALDDIATVSKQFEQLDRLANHSRTAVSGSIFGAGYAAITSPLQVLASALGGRALSTILARPATARAVANYAKAWAAAEKSANEGTYRALTSANLRLRDALEAAGISPYPPVVALIADRPIDDNEDNNE